MFMFLAAMSLISLSFLLLRSDARYEGPDRRPQPERLALLRYEPVEVEAGASIGPDFRLSGAWTIDSDDPRLAGISGLATTPRGLLALTDSGVVIDLPLPDSPRRVTRLRDLPSGPGWPNFKRYRDSEALVWDDRRNGWWVGFEFQHSLWLYDREFQRGREALSLRKRQWSVNKGVEALLLDSAGLPLLLPEPGRSVVRAASGDVARLRGVKGEIADAVRLPDGRVLVAQRSVGVTGIVNRLGWLERSGPAGYRVRQIGRLPLGPLDNVEGLAADRTAIGEDRVWAVTDNDGWRRTLLLRLDLASTAERRTRRARPAS